MKKILIFSVIALLVSVIYMGCSAGDSSVDQKLIYLQQESIEHTSDLNNLKIELKKANQKLDEQSAKIDTLIQCNKELVQIIKDNHAEDKGFFGVIVEKLSKIIR